MYGFLVVFFFQLANFQVSQYIICRYRRTSPDHGTLSLKVLSQTNTATNEVIHGIFRAFRRFVERSAGRLMRSINANGTAEEASTNLQPHKVGLYAID